MVFFFFSSRRRHTRYWRDWSSDVCSSDLRPRRALAAAVAGGCVFCTLGPSTPRVSAAAAPAPAVMAPAGLAWPGWTPQAPAERKRSAAVLHSREIAAPALPLAAFAPATSTPTMAAPAPSRYASEV